MEYQVNLVVDGRITVTVEAKSFEEAAAKASQNLDGVDFNAMDYVDCKPSIITAPNGQMRDFC